MNHPEILIKLAKIKQQELLERSRRVQPSRENRQSNAIIHVLKLYRKLKDIHSPKNTLGETCEK